MFDSVIWSTNLSVPIAKMCLLLGGEMLACFLLTIMLFFCSFHLWLMTKAMTTVEFCEKKLKKDSYDSSVYSAGVLGNIRAVLGPYCLMWLLPVCLPAGDGLDFSPNPVESVPLVEGETRR